jgi:hypothetical protein
MGLTKRKRDTEAVEERLTLERRAKSMRSSPRKGNGSTKTLASSRTGCHVEEVIKQDHGKQMSVLETLIETEENKTRVSTFKQGPSSVRLCGVCKLIDFGDMCYRASFITGSLISVMVKHHESYSPLNSAAKNGCQVCKAILKSYRKDIGERKFSWELDGPKDTSITCFPSDINHYIFARNEASLYRGVVTICFKQAYENGQNMFRASLRIFCEKGKLAF